MIWQSFINTGLFICVVLMAYAILQLSIELKMLKAQVKINSIYVMKRIK